MSGFLLTAQQKDLSPKVAHAEPLYNDLVRDLGARKGEQEWNAGWKLNDKAGYREQGGFIEYEFAPVSRLGLEMEIPFSYYYAEKPENKVVLPDRKIQSIKPALQYTFLVSEKYQLSMAVGSIYEVQLHAFKTMSGSGKWIKGHRLNPFFAAAKRIGRHFHVLLSTGPDLGLSDNSFAYQNNLSIHYVPAQSNCFIGMEINQESGGRTILRPQVKLRLSSSMALGLVTGIPLSTCGENLSVLMRLVYEPSKK